MAKPAVSNTKGNLGSLVVSALFVVVGLVTLWDTTSYTDRDSQVFPQTVALVLVLTAGISFVTHFLRPSESDGFGPGDWWRRLLLVITMILACFLMPVVGFLPAGAIAFAGGLVAAMHDRWSLKTLLLYWGFGGVIMMVFFALFKYALHVPLP